MTVIYSLRLVLCGLINRYSVRPKVLVILASDMQARAYKWISMLPQYFQDQNGDKRNIGNRGRKMSQKLEIWNHWLHIGWYVLIPLTVILYVGFDLTLPFTSFNAWIHSGFHYFLVYLFKINLLILACNYAWVSDQMLCLQDCKCTNSTSNSPAMRIFSNTQLQGMQMLLLSSFLSFSNISSVTLNKIHLYHEWPKLDSPGTLWCKMLCFISFRESISSSKL